MIFAREKLFLVLFAVVSITLINTAFLSVEKFSLKYQNETPYSSQESVKICVDEAEKSDDFFTYEPLHFASFDLAANFCSYLHKQNLYSFSFKTTLFKPPIFS